ncbi:hypothetical protein K431DRAFT_230080 [Polychaeton citri CBS 116435]|uniref:Uncharacterized protein n=1 Tax=Polychaeton citri CBS 116435 TaxID=1314669 RepID=A0A9P4Q5G1_9PEZI|nr:hypothetical protein K431DRAFT_230080 [Polychaeton citri CBS 116435]
MSDPVTEPGAPADTTTPPPQPQTPANSSATKGSAVDKAKKHAPMMLSLAKTPDRVILRLNKLLSTPGGLSSFLSTFNYTLYLLTYLEAKSVNLRLRLVGILNALLGSALSVSPVTATAPSRIAALASILSTTRTTLRLFGLPPMYAWLRQLLQGPKPGEDRVLYATSVTQCTVYIIYQFLENVGTLADNNILPSSAIARFNKTGKTARVYLWAYRAWMAGVACDFVRLFREAQLEKARRASRSADEKQVSTTVEADRKTDEAWWSDMVTPLSWFPVAAQFSLESGLPGFNLGVMGLCGGMAGLARTAKLWAATADEV